MSATGLGKRIKSSAWRGLATGYREVSVAEEVTSERAFAYGLSDPRSAVLSAVGVIQQPCTLCCSNRLLKNALAFSKVASFGACGDRHATVEARREVHAVTEQILALDHDVAETPIRNMMRAQAGLRPAARHRRELCPSLKGHHPALAGDAASASRPWRCSIRLASPIAGNVHAITAATRVRDSTARLRRGAARVRPHGPSPRPTALRKQGAGAGNRRNCRRLASSSHRPRHQACARS